MRDDFDLDGMYNDEPLDWQEILDAADDRPYSEEGEPPVCDDDLPF